MISSSGEFDGEMREFLAEQMRLKGIKLLFNTRINSIEQQDSHYLVNASGTDPLPAGPGHVCHRAAAEHGQPGA